MTYFIAQFEFIHVGGKEARSLQDVREECMERIQDATPLVLAGHDLGPGFKTVVRMYDTSGYATGLAKAYEAHEQVMLRYSAADNQDPFSALYARYRVGSQYKKMQRIRRRISEYYVKQLTEEFKSEWNVARETYNRSFRPAQRNEFVELLHAAQQAKYTWLYIFHPNSLLADENELVASVV